MELENPARRTMRIALAISFICLLGVGIAWGASGNRDTGWTMAAELTVAIGLVAGVVALIVGLYALTAVAAIDRTIEAFQAGHALADWPFDPGEWEIFVAEQKTWFATRGRIARMRAHPRVLIGSHAVAVGGVVTQWNVQMTVLTDVRTIGGCPMALEITLGPRGALQAVYTVLSILDFLSFLTGEGGSGMGDTKRTVKIPVPRERTPEVERVVAQLRSAAG